MPPRHAERHDDVPPPNPPGAIGNLSQERQGLAWDPPGEQRLEEKKGPLPRPRLHLPGEGGFPLGMRAPKVLGDPCTPLPYGALSSEHPRVGPGTRLCLHTHELAPQVGSKEEWTLGVIRGKEGRGRRQLDRGMRALTPGNCPGPWHEEGRCQAEGQWVPRVPRHGHPRSRAARPFQFTWLEMLK